MRFLALSLGLVAGCKSHHHPPPESAPPGEVWISSEQAQSLEIGSPALERVETVVRATGKIVFDEARIAHVFSAATGRVVSIFVELGADVRRGTPLALMHSLDVGTATSDVAKADADALAAEHEFGRKKMLYERHAASRADFDAAEDALRRARAERERAHQHAELLHIGDARSEGVTSDFIIRSPIAGQVIARTATPGVEVQGQYNGGGAVELFTVGRIDSVWLTADIFEVDLPNVHAGAPLRARTSAHPDRVFAGTVDWVASRLDPATRAARVRARFDNGDHALVPEMSAAVEIVKGSEDALIVPAEAVTRLGDANLVFADRGGAPNGRRRFEALRVVAAPFDDGKRARLISGVLPTDRVVVRNAILLTTS